MQSPPSRRRGLKSMLFLPLFQEVLVASLAEAWIEITITKAPYLAKPVASLAEAWIEILGLEWGGNWKSVASLAEAWIEMFCTRPAAQ